MQRPPSLPNLRSVISHSDGISRREILSLSAQRVLSIAMEGDVRRNRLLSTVTYAVCRYLFLDVAFPVEACLTDSSYVQQSWLSHRRLLPLLLPQPHAPGLPTRAPVLYYLDTHSVLCST